MLFSMANGKVRKYQHNVHGSCSGLVEFKATKSFFLKKKKKKKTMYTMVGMGFYVRNIVFSLNLPNKMEWNGIVNNRPSCRLSTILL